MLKAIAIGSLCGLICCSLLLIFLAFIFTKSSNPPHTLVEPLMMVATGIGTFIGGYISSIISKEKGMLCGILCGFLMFIFIFIAGLISVRESLTILTLVRLSIMLVSGALGGIIGVNKRIRR